MPLRKAPHADLRRTAMLRVQIAALLAVALPLLAFTVSADRAEAPSYGVENPYEKITVVPPPPTRHETAKPPPPPRPPVLIEVPDEVLIDFAEIDFSEEPPATVPLDLPPPIESEPAEQEDEGAFVIVEDPPEMLPSEPAAMAALQQCIRYPEMAKRAGIEGRVFVQFVVDETGRVTRPLIARGIGGGADEEALRCVQQVRFTPGYQRGKAVKVKFSLPVTFRLKG